MQQENYGKLLALNYNLFDLNDYDEIIDFIVNDSHKLIPYQLSLVYQIHSAHPNKIHIENISGTLGQEINVNFKTWLEDTIHIFHANLNNDEVGDANSKDSPKVHVIHPEDIDQEIKKTWADNLGQEVMITELFSNKDQRIYFVCFNEIKLSQELIINFNFIIKSYRQALRAHLQSKKAKRWHFKDKVYWLKVAVTVFICAMFVPITPSVMAPAEIVSEKTWVVNSPIKGRINRIKVDPNSMVKKGQVLFDYDQIDLRNNYRLKMQELKSLKTKQYQARAQGFDDLDERAKIFRLKQDISAKEQEVRYAKEQLNLSVVRSPEKGTVLFKDKNDLVGKPVSIGETVMRLADIDNSIVEIWLDVNDNMKLKKDMDVYYYSNSSPFNSRTAKLKYYSYEAYITPQENIAFRLVAEFDNKNDLIVGDHGKVKIYGVKRISLGRFIFQKPLATLRQWLYRII